MSKRKGDWIQTYTGVQFWPLDPRPEEISIIDIAHALSLQCRFAGHCSTFYSVAEHSVRVSREVAIWDALDGLMHDATEAYLVDLPRPLKRASEMGALYRDIEGRLALVIAQRFGLSESEPLSVKLADNVLLMTEKRDLMSPSPRKWAEIAGPLEEVIVPWSPEKAKQEFLNRFVELAQASRMTPHGRVATLGPEVGMNAVANEVYQEFLRSKRISAEPVGIEPSRMTPGMFPFQEDVVRWELRRGRAAMFEDCGLGKTLQELEWARQISESQGNPVLIVAPLAVSHQTYREGVKFGIETHIAVDDSTVRPGINITNYEKLHHFDPAKFCGLVLDESSILKGLDGKLRRYITGFARRIPYRLSASATPAPNDYMELGTQAEFLDIMSHQEMLATFFTHDGSDTSKWRLKGHAEREFWKWLASWAVCIRKPSDIGYDDNRFTLPPIHFHQHTVVSEATGGYLFPMEAQSLLERGQARRDSIGERVAKCAELVNNSDENWVVWCNLNAEGDALTAAIPGSIQVQGSDSPDYKEKHLLGFCEGNHRVMVTKPKIAGFGLNMQVCSRMAFVGLSDSYEQVYQAIRRCWRFGQKRDVHCHIIAADTEGAVVRNIQRKEAQSEKMAASMVEHMRDICRENIRGQVRERVEYINRNQMVLPAWLEGMNG